MTTKSRIGWSHPSEHRENPRQKEYDILNADTRRANADRDVDRRGGRVGGVRVPDRGDSWPRETEHDGQDFKQPSGLSRQENLDRWAERARSNSPTLARK